MKELPKDLQILLRGIEKTIRKGFLEAINAGASKVVLRELAAKLAAGDLPGAYAVLRIDPRMFGDLDRAITEGYWASGTSVSASVGDGTPFSIRTPQADAWVAKQAGELITNIVEGQREIVRYVLDVGLKNGRNPEVIARDIAGRMNRVTGRREGGFIGLTKPQSRYAQRAREELADPERMANYLTRKLRDRRFDATVRKAIEDGKPLSKTMIEKLVNRYNDRMLYARANLISHNEGLIAMEAGRREGYRQMIENGSIKAEKLRKIWHHTPREDPRLDHMAMDEKRVGLDDKFVFPDGVQMDRAHDPVGGAKHNLGCECWTEYKAVV